ncbi:MAG TPA: hypothetical protein VFZ52_24475 [Chryseolinea sp.]
MERRKIEDSFQEAFKNAEVNPSESVWTNIELDLERADGDKMKRRLLFFKTLAAASVIFAMSIAGIGYYVFQLDADKNLAQHEVNSPAFSDRHASKEELDAQSSPNNESSFTPEETDPVAANSETKESPATANNSRLADEQLSRENGGLSSELNKGTDAVSTQSDLDASDKLQGDKKITGKSGTPLLASDENRGTTLPDVSDEVNGVERAVNSPSLDSKNSSPAATTGVGIASVGESSGRLPALYSAVQPELKLPASTADPGMLLLAKLAEDEKRFAAEEKNTRKNKMENLWTSIGFAAGAFNANSPSVAPAANTMYYLNSASTASTQSKASGLSYSVGVTVGTQVSKRWVLQGGVNYLTQNSDYTANSVVVVDNNFESPKAASINAFAPQLADATANTKVAQTFPYNVNNSVRFMSLPVQAGYLLVDKKFGLQLNAGVSTDLFLQNTITPDGGGVASTTQGRGDESPYRSLNFSGLMGTEFTYKLGYRYRLSVNPGLRYPFSSVYKSNTGVDSTPLTFDVGLRFRYIFH